MNRRSIKFGFAIRTIAVFTAVLLIVSFAVTYIYAENYRKDMMRDLRTMGSYLYLDLKECRDVNKDSTAYEDGLDLAQANAVLQYYRIKKLNKFKDRGTDVDIALYRLETVSDGYEVTDYKEALPDSPLVLVKPYNSSGKIIVVGDVFTEEHLKDVEKALKKTDDFRISSFDGYDDGRFFYPASMTFGDVGDVKTIHSDYYRYGEETETLISETPMVIMPDGSTRGSWTEEAAVSEKLRKMNPQKGMFYIGTSGHSWGPFSDFSYESVEGLSSNRYALCIYAHGNHFAYALGHLKKLYGTLLFIFALMCIILIKTHNHRIDIKLETEASRRRMMDSMAHEMKTPLSVIRNYSEVLLEERDEEKKQRFVENIIDETDRLNNAIISMLDLSKMEAGTYPMELSMVSVKELVEREIEHKQILIDSKKLTVNLQMEAEELILADEKLVINIISNFLSNGIRHAVPETELVVRVKADSNGAEISVHNQGMYIPENEMERVWNSFYGRRDSGAEGSGLGLAIVRNACLMHRGSYGCNNENGGVTFWAKIHAMGENIRKAELSTGPVLGITGQNRLKGLPWAIAGMIMFSLGMAGNSVYLYYKVLYLFSGDNLFTRGFYSITEAILMLLGTAGVLYGMIVLSKDKAAEKGNVLMSIELTVFVIIEMAFSIWYTVASKHDMIDYVEPKFYYITTASELLILIIFFALAIRISEVCIRASRTMGYRRWEKICLWTMRVFMVTYVLCTIMQVMLYVPVLTNFFIVFYYYFKWAGYFIACMIPAVTWILTYKKFSKLPMRGGDYIE